MLLNSFCHILLKEFWPSMRWVLMKMGMFSTRPKDIYDKVLCRKTDVGKGMRELGSSNCDNRRDHSHMRVQWRQIACRSRWKFVLRLCKGSVSEVSVSEVGLCRVRERRSTRNESIDGTNACDPERWMKRILNVENATYLEKLVSCWSHLPLRIFSRNTSLSTYLFHQHVDTIVLPRI